MIVIWVIICPNPADCVIPCTNVEMQYFNLEILIPLRNIKQKTFKPKKEGGTRIEVFEHKETEQENKRSSIWLFRLQRLRFGFASVNVYQISKKN